MLVYRGAVVKAVYVLLAPLPHEATDGAAESGCRSKGGVASLLGYSVIVVREQCSLSDVQRGWILMEVGAQKVSSADALLCVVSKNVASP